MFSSAINSELGIFGDPFGPHASSDYFEYDRRLLTGLFREPDNEDAASDVSSSAPSSPPTPIPSGRLSFRFRSRQASTNSTNNAGVTSMPVSERFQSTAPTTPNTGNATAGADGGSTTSWSRMGMHRQRRHTIAGGEKMRQDDEMTRLIMQ
ncbi:hypothetical protein HK102_006244, partial [Quaeritorhiza haematococci]